LKTTITTPEKAHILPSFDELVSSITQSYSELEHEKGWRFLTVPRKTFETAPEVALITLNPGGDGPVATQGEASCEYGCAYRTEPWEDKKGPGESALQVQILALLEELRLRLAPGVDPVQFMDQRVLGAYYIPFRSRSLATLVSPRKSLAFARSLWTQILSAWTPRVIITIDQCAFDGIASILCERLTNRQQLPNSFPTGWGSCRFQSLRWAAPDRTNTTLVRFPHLSTYKLFSHAASLPRIKDVLDYATTRCVGSAAS
jgi:hypothetical protein